MRRIMKEACVRVTGLTLAALLLASCGASNTELLTRARSTEVKLMRDLPTGIMSWIHSQAAEVAAGRLDQAGVRASAQEHVQGQDPEGKGTNVLTFFVLMEAVRDLDKMSGDTEKRAAAIERARTQLEHLRGLVSGDMESNDKKKDSDPCACSRYEQALTGLATSLEESKTWFSMSVREPVDVGDLRSMKRDLSYLKDALDKENDLELFRIQEYQENKSRLEQMISNVMKAAAETESDIIKNLK